MTSMNKKPVRVGAGEMGEKEGSIMVSGVQGMG
jgi:hypothetical protein